MHRYLLRDGAINMIERLEIIKNKYEDMQKELMKPEVLSDINKTTELSREMASLEEIVNHYKRYMEVDKELEEAKEFMKDPGTKTRNFINTKRP